MGGGWAIIKKTPCRYEEDDGQEKQEAGVLSNPPNPTAEAKVNAPQHDITWYDISYSIYDIIETLNSKLHSDQPCNHSPSTYFDDLVVMTFRSWCSAAKLGDRPQTWCDLWWFHLDTVATRCISLEVYFSLGLSHRMGRVYKWKWSTYVHCMYVRHHFKDDW